MRSLQYHESKQRGSPDFPLDYHDIDQRHARYEMPYHWHEEFEILQVRSGTFFLTLDDVPYTLRAGDVAFIAAGRVHGGVPQACRYECVVFDLRLLLKSDDSCKAVIGDVINGRMLVQPYFQREDPVVRDTIPRLCSALNERYSGFSLVTRGCLFQFLGEVCRRGAYQISDEPGGSKRVFQLKRVFELIEGNYASTLTLAQLSASVHMTPKYFCRFFKEATHRTPMEYLCYYRIEMACYEMAATEKNATEIAMDAGFSNLNYFIRMFKKYKGVTPGQYLNRLRKNA